MKAPTPLPRALVVEDDHSWQAILSEILTDAGLAVDLADSLKGAVTSLRAAPHRLAVVDLSLGRADHTNQDGLRVLDAVRLHDPGCVPILLTGFATVELAVSALTEHGAFTCLRKAGFRRREFRELIHQALASAPTLPAVPRPLTAAPIAGSEKGEASAAAPEDGSAGLALIVEDDAGWRGILSELLAEAGYQVRLCSSFGEALGYLRREKYVLAVVDLSLTGPVAPAVPASGSGPSEHSQEGYRLLASTQNNGIPTVVVSGTASPVAIERAYAERGVFACLEKQAFDRRAFLHIVDEARNRVRPSDELGCLTDREREVIELLARGLTNKDIAEALVISDNTVKRHLKAIFEKLDVHTRAAAVARAVVAGVPSGVPDDKGEGEDINSC